MNNIDFNPIILIIIAAFIKGFDFLIKELILLFKRQYKNKQELIESEKTDKQKIKEFYEKIEELNVKEGIYKDKETARIMANNMAVLTNQTDCGRIITHLVLNSDVSRFILFHTHNGNGQPNSLKQFKVSYLQYNAIHVSEIRNYKNLEVDNPYAEMLINIQNSETHCVKIIVEEMDDCLLKEIYISESMKYVEVYFLCATTTGIIYTSLATDVLECDFKESRLKIKYAISQLKAIFDNERNRVFRDCIEHEENEARLKEIYLEKEKLKNIVK